MNDMFKLVCLLLGAAIWVVVSVSLLFADPIRDQVQIYPRQVDGQMIDGWVVDYHNVTTPHSGQQRYSEPVQGEDQIDFKITVTHNRPCIMVGKPDHLDCADHIRITDVPDGYIAVPEEITVREGDRVQILIILNLLG